MLVSTRCDTNLVHWGMCWKQLAASFVRLQLPELVKPVATAVRWYLMVGVVCMSLMSLRLIISDDADHPFVYLLTIYTSYLREISIHIICLFFNQSVLCFLLLSYMNSLYFWILCPHQIICKSFLSYSIKYLEIVLDSSLLSIPHIF